MTPELRYALRAVDNQSLIHAVIVCHSRNPKHLRRYLALREREHGADSSITAKARRLLVNAEQVAELERMAGL